MGRLIRVYWRDIPVRLLGRDGRRREHLGLPPRFQRAMERAALRAGKGESHALFDDWRREESACDGELSQALQAEADRLDAAFDPARLKALERAAGWGRGQGEGESAADRPGQAAQAPTDA